jgi:hypothetical protein
MKEHTELHCGKWKDYKSSEDGVNVFCLHGIRLRALVIASPPRRWRIIGRTVTGAMQGVGKRLDSPCSHDHRATIWRLHSCQYSGQATGWIAKESGFNYWQDRQIFLYLIASNTGLDTRGTSWGKAIGAWSWFINSMELKPPVPPLLKNFATFHRTWRFITVFTRALHWPLSWARAIHSISPHPISLRSLLILSSHLRLGLHSGLFPSDFLTRIIYTRVIPKVRSPMFKNIK